MSSPTRRRQHTSTRAGRYLRQQEGYEAFIPAPFPPTDVEFGTELVQILSRADRELGALAGSISILPNPDLFVFMYVRREAVLSSQIEGTQASLMDILEWEAYEQQAERRVDLDEVSNYIAALNYGLERAKELPLSLRLLREIHGKLMTGVRGGEPNKTPGEFRRSQNWIGGRSPSDARYVPPPVEAMNEALGEFEQFLHSESQFPLLIKIALAHAQFETIHPFLDGNGRIGRLLVSFLLCHHGVLEKPLLYLSIFFKENRQEYYDSLQAIRDHGAIEQWLEFFLEGVATVAKEATETARAIVGLRESLREKVAQQLGRRSGNAQVLLDHLFENPFVNVQQAQRRLGVTQPTANSLVNDLARIGVLREYTGRRRERRFLLDEYIQLFKERDQRS
jgi:Fic family protein